MIPEDLIQRMKKDTEEGSGLTHDTLITLKKFLQDSKNAQNMQNMRPPQFLMFKQKVIGYVISTFSKFQPTSKDKILMLEILERDLISSKHNINLFNKLYNFLQQQDQTVAIQASKTIDALIKQINQGQQATPGAPPLDIRNHYIKLFQFLKEKTEFLLRLSEHVKGEQFKVYKRQSYDEREKDKDKDKKQVVFKNNKSLKFINQVPHLFIHLMAYVDTSNRGSQDDSKIKQLIKKSIQNIILALRRTPYEEFYQEFNYDFNNELFAVMTKLLQFLFINLRSDKQSGSSSNKSNQNLKKNIADQAQHIRVPQVIKNFIYLLKNCSEDFQLNRYEIVNRLRLLLTNLDKNKLSKNDAIQIMNEILNEETIFGKKKILGDYSKNAICSYWIQIIKSNVLINNVFPGNILSVRSVCQNSTLAQDSKQIVQCFNNIEKLVEQVMKTVFDNSIYPSVQQKCIDLIIYFIEQLFPEGIQQGEALTYLGQSATAKRIHEHKMKILLKILHSTSLKFLSIRQTFQQIDDYVTRKLGHKATKKDLPEPLKLNHMQLSSLNVNSQSANWKKDFVQFIQGYDQDIDSSLLTLTAVQNRFLTIYEEDDQLCFNSHPVKLNNYTLYMKQVKTKLLEKCINLSNKITKTFLIQNLETYSPLEYQALKSIYYVVSAKRNLTSDQCRILSCILKNGLKIFEILHNYDLHSDEQTNKRGHLKNFMLIFAQIYDPVNFRDIFEPNMGQFFRNLIIYAKNCSEFCLQHVLIEPYCSNQQNQLFNKNIVELLTYNLILRLESTSDQLDPFHEFYDYKQEYFLLLQKLIRFPFRCLSRYSDDSFIRNYFRQIILFLTKKAHTSRFCLDYLHLMRTLFKNILFNSNRESASPLFQQFYAICCKNSNQNQVPSTSSSVFVNVNILQNFLKFFDTGIPQLADIVTQLVIMLPLKSKHIIQFAKQGYIVKPLLHCLCLMSDYNYLLRTLKTFEIIISHSTADEINSFLQGVKDKLINRLFEMVVSQYKSGELKPQKINNDLSSLSLKLLAKLGCLSRNRDLTLQMKQRAEENKIPEDFQLVYQDFKENKRFTISLIPSIEYALEVFHKLLDSYYQSVVYISMEVIERCFYLLMDTLPAVLSKMTQLSQKIIAVFSSILALSSKYLTISQSILSKLRQTVKKALKEQAQVVKEELKTCGLTQYCKFYIKCIIQNLNERVLITRQDNFIKQISQQPKKFLWQLVLDMLQFMKQNLSHTESYEQTGQYIIRLLISQIIMVKNPNHVYLNNYQRDYNHVLPFKNAALSALTQLLDLIPQTVLQATYPDILNSIFIVVGTLPDILNLKISKHPQVIARKIYKYVLKDQNRYLKDFKTQKGQQVFTCILENLVGYSLEAHKIAIMFLHMIINQTSLKLHELLFGNISWEEIQDNTCQQTNTQTRLQLSDFAIKEKQGKKYPVIQLVKSLLRISHNQSAENMKNQKILKMLTNTFSTFELLISMKYNDQFYQAFQILTKVKENQEFVEENVAFTENFRKIICIAQQIITINNSIYDGFSKIIIQQPNPAQNPMNPQMNRNPPQQGANQQQQAPQQQAQQGSNVPPGQQAPPLRARDPSQVPPISTPPPAQTFNINTNTFIDDQEYGLNIQDLDMEVKIWGGLVSSVLKFLKTILINKTVFAVSKQMLRKKTQKSKLIDTRLQIIFTMFDLIGRVDRSVRDTSYQCLKDLLSREQHPKELIQNDDKLKHILRPVLISLQLQFKKFTPSFLIMFKKILKLLTQCFNITLIQKLVDKLRQMDRNKQTQSINQSRSIAPNLPGVKQLNYSQITNEVKCIASFLGLFQHLAYAYHNHRSQNYTVNSIIIIFKYITNISKFFTPKLGKHTITVYIKKTLAKVFNTMCEKLSGEAIFVDSQQRELDLQNFLQLLKLEQSFPLREKLTRQTAYIQKTFAQYSKTKKKDYYVFLDIVYTLAKRSNRWMKGMIGLADRVGQEINAMVQYKCKKFEERRQTQREWNQRNELVLLGKILLEYCKQNTDDTKALFTLVLLFKVRSTFDLHFLRRYLKYQLYDKISPPTKRRIMLEFLSLLKNPQSNDAQRILSISQNIIYYLILIQVNLPIEKRSIIIRDQQIMRSISQTIKFCLNPRNLYIKGNTHLSQKQISYNCRIGIQVLQITNLMLNAYKDIIPEPYKNNMLLTVWGLLRLQDKIIKNYAFVWTSNYIRVFEGFDHTRALGLYLTLIRGLESLSQGDFEIGALIKKSLNILIPYWDNKPLSTNGNWIEWSLKAVHEQSSEPNRLVRFWEIVVKNHSIFHKFKQNKFETQMVNSMQWLMVANNPTSSNPLIKKIASDMSFIYIQWKFKQAQLKLKEKLTLQDKEQSIDEVNKQSNTDRAAQICLNFFIKVALNNSSDKDDKQIMKRSLYLLKKTLILWPHTKKKFESIKIIVNKLKGAQGSNQQSSAQLPLRFHYTLLNIINILMSYEPDGKLLPQLTMIFKLLQLGGHISPQRFGSNAPQVPPNSATSTLGGSTIFTMNNIYLLNLLCTIVKRLVKIAVENQAHEESQKLMQEIHQYIRDGFEYHVITGNRSRAATTGQRNVPMKKIQVQVAISFLKILYEMDSKLIEPHLNYIKQVASSLKKMFQKGFETSSKNNNPSRVFELPSLVESSLQQMLQKDLQINIQLVKEQNMAYYQQNYQKQNIKSYSTRRPLFVVLVRILAAKFNCISHIQDKSSTLDIFVSIYQKIPDPQLKIQVINILKCMFIGPSAFKESQVPLKYQDIEVIVYPTNKVFFLLLQDNNKFNQHFQRRKSKPSDQNYNINERIYEQITTKIYFSFLCTYIIHLQKTGQLKPMYLEKVKIFILYAVKIVEGELIDQIFNIINGAYENMGLDFYSSLFEDYKELNCAEQYLQGDQIMVFLTLYLYKKAIHNYSVTTSIFGSQSNSDFHNHFVNFLKVQHYSIHHIQNISNTFKLATTKLLPKTRNFPRILKQYLLTGSYNQTWGSVLLKIAIDEFQCLNPQEMYNISTRINQWGMLLKFLEQGKTQQCYTLLDFVYRAYGDRDLINGYRMFVSDSPQIQKALALLQQRKYVQTLKIVNQLQSNKLKRMNVSEDQTTEQPIATLEELLQDNYISDISKECYKNLDKWEEILEERNQPLDMQGKIDYLFHSKGQKNKINEILGHLDQLNNRQFPYFYGKSIINFLESNTTQNKQLNISLLFSLLEWLSFPKNATMNQNRMLVKIQCLLQLEQGQKIKQESLTSNSEHPMLVDALTKVVQSVYTQINSWRERMPYKHEDMSTWHAILGQRVMIYDFMKSKMLGLLDSVLKSSNHTHTNMQTATQKLLVPYTDIEWNKLKLCKQQRTYGIYQSHSVSATSGSLYLDEIFLKQKQKFYYAFEQQKDHPKALQVIDSAIKQIMKDQGSHRDEELIKLQRLQLMRLKAKVFVQDGYFEQANQIYLDNLKGVEQHLLSLWRDWMVMCIKAYDKTRKVSWARAAISVFPYALRYKSKKTRLLLSPVINILKELANQESIVTALTAALQSIPYKNLILWIPQLIKLTQSNDKISGLISKIMTKLSINFPQITFYVFKPLFKGVELKVLREIYMNAKRINYNIVTKLQNFMGGILQVRNQQSVSIGTMGYLSRCFAEVQIPLYQTYKGDAEETMIPYISQIEQRIDYEIFNGVRCKVITLLGSDGKEYRYRLQKYPKPEKKQPLSNLQGQEYLNMVSSQLLEITHNLLGYWKESAIRKLKILQTKKIFAQQDFAIVKSSKSQITMHDILAQFLNKSSYGAEFPQSDKSFVGNNKLPRKELNKSINKRMKQIVPNTVMKDYFAQKATNYDEYNGFRKIFAYQYGTVCALHYVLGIETGLQNLTFDTKNGFVYINSLRFNFEDSNVSPFSLRLSRNISAFIDKTLLNAAILPAFSATIDALNNPKFGFKKYILMIHKQLSLNFRSTTSQDSFVVDRLTDMNQNLNKARKVIQLSQMVAGSGQVPYHLKYWF